MTEELTLRVITPDRIVLDTTASAVRFEALDGSMGVLPKHAHMVVALDAGELRYRAGSGEQSLFVSSGFAEVKDDTLRLVCEAGEGREEIDEQRARAAEQRARKRLEEAHDGSGEIDVARAQASLRRSLARIRVLGH